MAGRGSVRRASGALFLGTSALAIMSVLSLSAAARAQDEGVETVVVTGYRASIESAVEAKHSSAMMIDQINAEDIGQFPETNLADSMANLPGVDVDRGDTGEARTITVRGLGADFTLVRINGMDALSTAGSVGAQTTANRSRGFDFNTFASELFRSLKVQKSAGAASEEGSLGAIVDLNTGRPLDFDGLKLALNAEEQYFDISGTARPRVSALVAEQFLDHTLGVTFSVSYSKRASTNDYYSRSSGASEFLYRGGQFSTDDESSYYDAYGFALPSDDARCSSLTNSTGIGCGSDSDAYYTLTHFEDGTETYNALFPCLPTLNHNKMSYDRLGLTGSIEWRPTSQFDITADYMYAMYKQSSITYRLSTVGLNRNNFSATLATNPSYYAGLEAGDEDLRDLYQECYETSYYCADNTTGLGQPSLVDGTYYSYNANNLEPYDYYNNSRYSSLYSDAGTAYGVSGLVATMGKTNTKVTAAHVIQATAPDGTQQLYVDSFSLDDVDWSSVADGTDNTTNFRQWDVNGTYTVSDDLTLNLFYGESGSTLRQDGQSVGINAMDMDGYTFSESGNMPTIIPGFDVADPTNWVSYKGLSTQRRYTQLVQNWFTTIRAEGNYNFGDGASVDFGGDQRIFKNHKEQSNRVDNDAIVPTYEEVSYYKYGDFTDEHVSDVRNSLGQVVSFGAGLDVPDGTPKSWFAPNLKAYNKLFGLDSGEVTDWGDYRLAQDTRVNNTVVEKDYSYYVQFNFDDYILDHRVIGNIGFRSTNTNVQAAGYIGGNAYGEGFQVSAENSYHDFLPSFNLGIDLLENLRLRFAVAKVMSRPMLEALSVGSTSFSTYVPSTGNPSVTLGNPYLKPIRSNNYDASIEWYFDKGSILSVAYFRKSIRNYPQQILSTGALSDALGGVNSTTYETTLDNMEDALRAYTEAGGNWDIRKYMTTPGGQIEGLEISYQHTFTFLPAPFDRLGMQINATHLSSSLKYIVNGDTMAYYTAPWLNNSPNAVNMTVFYGISGFNIRLNGSYRAGYYNSFPLSTGTCEAGTDTNNGAACSSPVLEDFQKVAQQIRLNMSGSYEINKNVSISFDAQNLLAATDKSSIFKAVNFASRYSASGRIFRIGFRFKN